MENIQNRMAIRLDPDAEGLPCHWCDEVTATAQPEMYLQTGDGWDSCASCAPGTTTPGW